MIPGNKSFVPQDRGQGSVSWRILTQNSDRKTEDRSAITRAPPRDCRPRAGREGHSRLSPPGAANVVAGFEVRKKLHSLTTNVLSSRGVNHCLLISMSLLVPVMGQFYSTADVNLYTNSRVISDLVARQRSLSP